MTDVDIDERLQTQVRGKAQTLKERYENGDLAHYIRKQYNYRITIGADGTFLHGKVQLAGGGPTVWLNTGTKEVEGHWGTSNEIYHVPDDVIDEVNATLRTMYEAV